jgi:hypothetical protein
VEENQLGVLVKLQSAELVESFLCHVHREALTLCHVCAAGGFLTGWKGLSVLAAGIAVAAVIAGTGYLGSKNSTAKIVEADVKYIDQNSSVLRFCYNQPNHIFLLACCASLLAC